MPFVVRKLPNKNKYKVYNYDTKKVHSYHTNRLNAMKQVDLLHRITGEGLTQSRVSYEDIPEIIEGDQLDNLITRGDIPTLNLIRQTYRNIIPNQLYRADTGDFYRFTVTQIARIHQHFGTPSGRKTLNNPDLQYDKHSGTGIFGDTFNRVKNFATNLTHKVVDVTQKVIHGRKTLSPKVENILRKIGDAQITGIKIGRTPVPSLITGILKVVSTTPYDKLFHLFLVLSTNKGEVSLEKNEVINMDLNPNIKAEYVTIHNIPNNVTVNELIHNTQKRMGDHKFISYSGYDNNCQHFIKNVLLANGMNEGLDFVKQDTEDIFREHPNLRKFANTVTDLAGRANVVLQGGKMNKKGTGIMNVNDALKLAGEITAGIGGFVLLDRLYRWAYRRFQNHEAIPVPIAEVLHAHNLLPLPQAEIEFTNQTPLADVEIGRGNIQSNGLYADEIENILKDYHINGVYSKDKLPIDLKNGWYVINLQSTNEGDRKGTHWVCFKSINGAKIIEYFDAFGFAPPIEIMEKAKGNILYSEMEIQDTNATTCGWFCIGAVVSDKGYGTPQSHFNKYISMFSKNTHINDRILSKYLHSKGIQ